VLIPIPIGKKYTATVHGETWKVVRCEGCGKHYAYRMKVQAQAQAAAYTFSPVLDNEERAQHEAVFHATKALQQAARRASAAVPCPQCGAYQRDMFARVRRRKVHPLQLVGALVFACGPALLLLDEPAALTYAVIVGLFGLGLVACGMLLRRRIDPNAGGPEPRRRLGRSAAVWGEELERLVQSGQVQGGQG
jgi:hypothetical protein